jgi:serine/threonine protein kinase
MIKTN